MQAKPTQLMPRGAGEQQPVPHACSAEPRGDGAAVPGSCLTRSAPLLLPACTAARYRAELKAFFFSSPHSLFLF